MKPLATTRLAATRLAAALGLSVALLAQPALAAPTLRAEALISADLVTLGDLIDGAGAKADTALFRAPDLGQTGAVPAATVIEAARRAGLRDVVSGGFSEVSVIRLSREIATATVANAIAVRAAASLDADADAMRVTLDDDAPLHLDPAATGALDIGRFVLDPRTGRFEANLAVAGLPSSAAPRRVTGTAIETVEAATTARSLARGDVLSAADIVMARLPKAQNPDALGFAAAKGLATRRNIREGQALRASDLMRPQHVDRGDFVTLIYGGGGMSLSLKAKALQSGAQGDLVSVQNIQSKRTVNGVVTGPSEVTVTAAATAIARR